MRVLWDLIARMLALSAYLIIAGAVHQVTNTWVAALVIAVISVGFLFAVAKAAGVKMRTQRP